MKARLSKSVIQFREQADDAYPDRDRRSDGTWADARHATQKSDHNACPDTGFVRAFDLDASLELHMSFLISELRAKERSGAGLNTEVRTHTFRTFTSASQKLAMKIVRFFKSHY